MKKTYIALFLAEGVPDDDQGPEWEYYEDVTLAEAIDQATRRDRHYDFGHRGIKIYEMGSEVAYEDFDPA